MKIAVIGAGIIGVTSAYELARQGHEVTVLERSGAACQEASFANAGVISPGYVTPWAAPGMSWKVLRQMLSPHAAFRVRWPLHFNELAWLWDFWRACREDVYRPHRSALQQLALFSRECLHEISERHAMAYDQSSGYLIALRSEKERVNLAPSLSVLRELGVAYSELDEAGARLVEPAINSDTRFAGAIHLPNDEVANCRQFALLLKAEAQRLGVEFLFNSHVSNIDFSAEKHAGPATILVANIGSSAAAAKRAERSLGFDAVVLCTGAQSSAFLKSCKIKLPLASVYGYSVSAYVKEMLDAPRSGLMDERYKVSITRLGQRVRVAGSAQIGGASGQMSAAALQTLYKVLHDWFPGAAVMSQGVQEWQGARPMLANRPPVIGASPQKGLWLNVGHGSSGWALACGSAALLAAQIKAEPKGIPTWAGQFSLS